MRKVANCLRIRGIRVFFDEYSEADMWGKDLYTHLDDIYQNAARYCILFISISYARKVWTNHERESAQARAIKEHGEYILPARFDSTVIPGLRSTIGYVDLRKKSPQQIADLMKRKLGTVPVKDFFPPIPDRLFVKMGAKSAKAKMIVERRAYDFFRSLTRMDQDERRAVITMFLNACPAELPDNVHIDVDLLRRLTGFPPSKLVRLLSGVQSLGFTIRLRKGQKDNCIGHEGQVIVAEWNDMSTQPDVIGNATAEASTIIWIVASNYCEKHALEALLQLDFTSLSIKTRTDDVH